VTNTRPGDPLARNRWIQSNCSSISSGSNGCSSNSGNRSSRWQGSSSGNSSGGGSGTIRTGSGRQLLPSRTRMYGQLAPY
jgi:hypothetical protein